MRKIAIIGAGAAGCFCAIETKRRLPDADIHLFESGSKALAKVAITGGGRCNLTNTNPLLSPAKGRERGKGSDALDSLYPRGHRVMKRVLARFSNEDVMEWFEREGVRLVVQDDGCVFPKSQDAMEIVNTLLHLIYIYKIKIHLRQKVVSVVHQESGEYQLTIKEVAKNDENTLSERFDSVVVTTGGSPKESGLSFLAPLGLDIVLPVPSLFTFNIDDSTYRKQANASYTDLMGTVVEDVTVSLSGLKQKAHGALLWTHWGVSGPAILKLTSYGARILAEREEEANVTDAKNREIGTLTVNWCGEMGEEEVRQMVSTMAAENQGKSIANVYPRFLTSKHWQHILALCSIPSTQRWGALNKTHLNRLISTLTAQQLKITGRSRFKEEFVTCGGVALSNIDPNTMECKKHKALYLAGEVLDVDAVTGGYNLQAAWSMGYVISQNIK